MSTTNMMPCFLAIPAVFAMSTILQRGLLGVSQKIIFVSGLMKDSMLPLSSASSQVTSTPNLSSINETL